LKTFSPVISAVLLVASSAFGAPPLTTIRDVLYKADGTRFNGLVTIAWSSFLAPDQSSIPTQLLTVNVVNGNLLVQLVPNTETDPVVYYSVTYNSDGNNQFSEQWAVPPSSQALRIQDVRVASVQPGNDTTAAGPVNESDVVGLSADLSARPLKGPAFAPGSVAVVNAQGSIDAVSGNASDCVHVDGSSGPCGSSQPSFLDADVPAGLVDGANILFTLSGAPNPASSLSLFRNGILQERGTDYSLANNVIQFLAAPPQPADVLVASYRLSNGSGSGSPQLFSSPQVLCSGTGATINATSNTSLASCSIPANTLMAGDRVEIRFDLAHQGGTGGFTFQVLWGSTTAFQRSASPTDAQVSGRADAGLDQAGAQISTQSWGTTLPFSATVGAATDRYSSGLVIGFQGAMVVASETLTLRNYAVVRVP